MDSRIVRAVRLIERDMADSICFDTVAARVGLSSSRFHHLFRETVGQPPETYLRRIRLDAAALRLQWTSEPVGLIAIGLGYQSQAAFTKAFQRRFGMPPQRYRTEYLRTVLSDSVPAGRSRISVREVPSFTMLAARYVGNPWEVREYWRDFEKRLPPGKQRWKNSIFVGLLHDDPRTTPVHETRYDCCVVLTDGASLDWQTAAANGLQLIRSRPGPYGCLRFRGHRDDLLPAYDLLCTHWVRNSSFAITEDPAIEVHARPRHRMDVDKLDLTLLLALE